VRQRQPALIFQNRAVSNGDIRREIKLPAAQRGRQGTQQPRVADRPQSFTAERISIPAPITLAPGSGSGRLTGVTVQSDNVPLPWSIVNQGRTEVDVGTRDRTDVNIGAMRVK
jgi:hypothetical protein